MIAARSCPRMSAPDRSREGFQDELRMLMRVQNLYRRHPEIEVIAADIFQARLFEKAEPNYNTVLLAKLADSDFEILEYLRDNAFTLLPRLKFVRQRVAELRERLKPVTCPICKSGKLRLDPSTWRDPNCSCELPLAGN